MKPIRLKMTAFGPYAEEQVVDFRKSLNSGLFGIYGPTGAGKSSIFAAIEFALFGETSRTGKDTTTLRSDHASPDTTTELDLVFEVGTKRYLVRRQPEQGRPKKRGEGFTTSAATAWLFDVSGIELDDLSAKHTGEILAEKKVTAVTEQVVSILGYGAEQFRQIVLLPQGQFEKFLSSDTEVRVQILRKLFDVSVFKALTEKLANEAREKLDEFRVKTAALETQLKNSDYESLDELMEKIISEKATLDGLQTIENEAKEKIEVLRKELEAAKKLDNLFVAAEDAQKTLDVLEKQRDEITEKRATLKLAESASKALDLYKARETAETKLHEQVEASSDADKRAETSQKDLAAKEQKLVDIKKDNDKREKQEAERIKLDGFKARLDDAQALKAKLAETQASHERLTETLDAKKVDLDKLKEEGDKDVQTLSLMTAQSEELQALSEELSKIAQAKDVAKAYETHKAKLEKSTEAVTLAEKNFAKSEKELTSSKQQYELAEASLAEAQAVHLARSLEDGVACPVCGSLEHPDPAHANLEDGERDKKFRQAKSEFEAAQSAYATALAQKDERTSSHDEVKNEFEALPAPEKSTADYVVEIESVKEKIDALKPKETSKAIQGRMTKRDKEYEALKEEIAALESNAAMAKSAFEKATTLYQEKLRDIPKALQDSVKLHEKLSAVIGWNDDFDLKLKQAVEDLEASKTANQTALNQKTRELGLLDSARSSSQAAVTNFDDRLAELKISEDDFERGKAEVDNLAELAAEIAGHDQSLATARANLQKAKNVLEDMVRPELASFEENVATAEAFYNGAIENRAELASKISASETMHQKISDEFDKIETDKADFEILGRLSKEFNGDNAAKMTLETYAIAAMFERVLEAANMRLGPMSGGRYSLERSGEGKGRAKRGLGISVHDTHTGKARQTKSLSGGESFLAALSLALGLSDVVQSTAGGIRLETIFIDEGFGTLDQQTLDQAMQTLLDLTAGNRTLGLISHVEMVQQSIPHGFQIEPGHRGSRVVERQT